MNFYSDNCGPALPEVMAALTSANSGYQPSYGDDALMDQVRQQMRDLFEAPEAETYLVATGTAANALALGTLADPWQTIFCAPLSHINVDECNAPEFYSGGAKLTLVGEHDKFTAQELETALQALPKGDVHVPQHGPVSLTQVTERGRLHSLSELAALGEVAQAHNLPVFMDGARFSNAIMALGCSPAEMTWKVGVDAVSFGGTKNGCLGVEAVVFFDPKHAWEFELRRKRGAHLFSKHRYLSAQMAAYLTDEVWKRSALAANERGAYLAEGLRSVPGARFVFEPEANMIFATLPRRTHQRLAKAGAVYTKMDGPIETGDADEPLAMRLVCDWSLPFAEIDRFLEVARG